MIPVDRDRLAHLQVIPAAAAAGALLGLLEGSRSAAAPSAALLSASVILFAAAGTLLGMAAALASIARTLLPLRRRRLALYLVMAGFALALSMLAATGALKRPSFGEATLFLFLGAMLAGSVLVAIFERDLARRTRVALVILVAAGAVTAALLDPGGYRGTYLSIDLLLLGGTFALGTAALRPRPWWNPLAILGAVGVAIILLLARAGAASTAEAAQVMGGSPRAAFLGRLLQRVDALPRPVAPHSAEVPPDQLFAPPEDPAVTRARWAAHRRAKRPLSVLWVLLDAVRHDVTGLGGGRATPELDRFGMGAFRFRRAWSQAPGTAVSVESMMTSRYPARTAVALAWESGTEKVRFQPIAGLFGTAGWRTFFATSLRHEKLEERTFVRLKRGFDTIVTARGETDALETASAAAALLEAEPDKPFFAWVHFFDPHFPYERREGAPVGASPRELWESEVRYADRALRIVLDALAASGRAEDTIVVVNSDHAEAFGEHGRYYHATSYFEDQIRIPLTIRVPGLEPAIIEAPVSNIDLGPTLLDLVNLEIPGTMQGHSLLPVMLDPSQSFPRAAFAETLIIEPDARWPEDRTRIVTDGRWKLLDLRSQSMHLLFDIEQDPGETRNLITRNQDEAARLLGWLSALDAWCDAKDASIDQNHADSARWPALREQLRHPSPIERQAALHWMLVNARVDLAEPLELLLPELTPDTAHQVLLLLDVLLEAESSAKPGDLELPPEPHPLRLRILERYAHSPRWTGSSLPEVPPPLAALEVQALEEARAVRGDGAAIAALAHTEPLSRAAWARLAPVLARGGDARAAELLLQLLRVDAPDASLLMRAAFALAPAHRARLENLIVHQWPAPQPKLPPKAFAALVDLACSIPLGVEPLLALHSAASPAERRRLADAMHAQAPLLGAELIAKASTAWAEARFVEGTPAAASKLEHALESIRGTPSPELELERALATDVPRDGAAAIAIAIQGVPSSPSSRTAGPPRLKLESGPERKSVALGPGNLPRLDIEWRDGTRAHPAATVWLPRTRLDATQSLELPLALDYPNAAGEWRLALTEDTGRALLLEPISVYAVPATNVWEGPAIARLFTAVGLTPRVLESSAGIEIFAGGQSSLRSPNVELDAGEHEVALTLTAWFSASEKGYVSHVQVGSAAPVAFAPAVTRGIPTTVRARVRVESSEPASLTILWPTAEALLSVERIAILR